MQDFRRAGDDFGVRSLTTSTGILVGCGEAAHDTSCLAMLFEIVAGGQCFRGSRGIYHPSVPSLEQYKSRIV